MHGIRAVCTGGAVIGWLILVVAAGFAPGVMIGLLAIPAAAVGWLLMTTFLLLPRGEDRPAAMALAGAAAVVLAAALVVVGLIAELDRMAGFILDAQRHGSVAWTWTKADSVALLASVGAGALAGTGLALRGDGHPAWAIGAGLVMALTVPAAVGVMVLAAAMGWLPLTA